MKLPLFVEQRFTYFSISTLPVRSAV